MNLRFPLSDVSITFVAQKKQVEAPLYDDGYYSVNQHEFSIDVEEVGHFYAAQGNRIEIVPYPGVNQATLELYLNGSTYGAILHQRKIMPLHGSCFEFEGKGIMLCGESGAGKSSLTAAFCQKGSLFITDDVSPVVFKNDQAHVLPLSDRIKLWEDSLEQLGLSLEKQHQIASWYQKYYHTIEGEKAESYTLNYIFLIEKSERKEVQFQKLVGVELFTELRNQIYRWEYLKGMPESEKKYLTELIRMSTETVTYKVTRPEKIEIDTFRGLLADYIRTINNGRNEKV